MFFLSIFIMFFLNFYEIPLFHAINSDQREIVRILLEHGSTMNIGNRLALQFAARRERGFCCQILMNFGADRDKKDPNGKTAFSIAYEKKDPLPELILGSESNIPTAKNEMDIILELNDLIKKENADLWSNFDLDPTPHDDDDFRFFLKSLSALERRMKRFDQFLEIQLKNYEENLNSIHENLQSNDPELEKLKQDILSQFDAKLKRSFEVQKNIQKDLYTPNGSEALHRWNNVIKERMQFIIDLVAHADNNSEETIKEYKRNKICYDRIKSIHSANNEKVKSLDQKIRSYLYNLPRLSSETAKIVNNLNAQLDGPLYIESRTSTSPMPSQRVSKSNRA
ncbi:hypothetical protein TRFO_12087 [Tritrichomonas foetus]|uniref:Uncharacterized protein n=1 Tax=Tritrichomonas foetus TaxID=1144522 RepID=A0A1J4J794_9EUKA|nr:hypothetical protein TRFO_12087 [Tritrichomonas foetus]|eukprot:OHS93068.1 hypothetical protein TRFO_12087 [Tritrichomonas foetus]